MLGPSIQSPDQDRVDREALERGLCEGFGVAAELSPQGPKHPPRGTVLPGEDGLGLAELRADEELPPDLARQRAALPAGDQGQRGRAPRLTPLAEDAFARLAAFASRATGSVWAFSGALLVIGAWAVTGPLFGFSDAWQLVINTSTTIVTFLMVFIIQHAQNREMHAVQLKLNELVAAMKGASNRLIDVEDLSEGELEHLLQRYRRLARSATRLEPGSSTSVDQENG